jgi:hypothetical protein
VYIKHDSTIYARIKFTDMRKHVVLPYFSDHYATNFFLTSPGVAYPSAEWGRSKL